MDEIQKQRLVQLTEFLTNRYITEQEYKEYQALNQQLLEEMKQQTHQKK